MLKKVENPKMTRLQRLELKHKKFREAEAERRKKEAEQGIETYIDYWIPRAYEWERLYNNIAWICEKISDDIEKKLDDIDQKRENDENYDGTYDFCLLGRRIGNNFAECYSALSDFINTAEFFHDIRYPEEEEKYDVKHADFSS